MSEVKNTQEKNVPDSTGIGVLSMFWKDMKPRKSQKKAAEDKPVKPFTMRGVYRRLALAAILSMADLMIQALWVVHSHNIGWDPWWLGVLGIDSSRFDALGLLASIVGLSAILGLVFMLAGLFFSHVRWVFLSGMAMTIAGISRMLGTGLGRTLLYADIVSGKLSADDLFFNYYQSGVTTLEPSDTVYGAWPAVAVALVFAFIALIFALRPQTGHSSKLRLGLGAVITVGLLGTVLVEAGFMPTRFVLVLIALIVGFITLPGEISLAQSYAEKGADGRWQWHAAGLIWLEALLTFTIAIVAVMGI
ncbi:MAG: hypothetical protein Q4C69_13905 [Lachnoclostridium edouardi]|uniref:hypothetical protein n=1 Tax=Lachnoclostridium edouardi TaxID=1926283 RepID=UPI0026DD39AC|nr:hypothetical protein [Lachnoclostridium edouardi]MDO4279917.1 hypothetical protein [Lachnoclostridium edouardi]